MRNFILLWFLVSVSLIGLVSLAGVVWTGPYLLLSTWNFYGSDLVEYAAHSAVTAFESGGLGALQSFETRALPGQRMHAFLFNASSEEIDGHSASPRIRQFAQQLHTGQPVHFEPEGRGLLAGALVSGAEGRPYRLVLSFVSRRGNFVPTSFWGWAVRIGTMLLAAAMLCSWLAWRLSAPLGRLQETARKFAAGDLSARAGAASFPRRPPEYGALAHDFDEMAHRIQTLVNSQRQLLRDVSHELRTPLTRLGLAGNIARSAQGAPLLASLDRIDLESGRLNALIERIIRLSRLESLVETPRRDLIELSDFIDSIVSDADFEAEARNRKVTLNCCDKAHLHGDRELLREALENVIRNAIRFTPESTSVDVEGRCVNASEYSILIHDQGPGVPAGHLAAIFDPFHRAPPSTGVAQDGFGLGLSIAKRAIDLHHGSITACNSDAAGFEISIRLPLKLIKNGG